MSEGSEVAYRYKVTSIGIQVYGMPGAGSCSLTNTCRASQDFENSRPS